MMDLLKQSCLSSNPYSSLLGPSRSDVYTVDGKGKHVGHGIATVGNAIGFEESRLSFILLIGFDRYTFA
jgi:hypothetical protein